MKLIWEDSVRRHLLGKARNIVQKQTVLLQKQRLEYKSYDNLCSELETITKKFIETNNNGVLPQVADLKGTNYASQTTYDLGASDNFANDFLPSRNELIKKIKEFDQELSRQKKYWVSYLDEENLAFQLLDKYFQDKQNIFLNIGSEQEKQHPYYHYFCQEDKRYRQQNLLNWELARKNKLLSQWNTQASMADYTAKSTSTNLVRVKKALDYYLASIAGQPNGKQAASLLRHNLYLQGKVGAGKTYAAQALCRSLLELGFFTMMLSIKDVLERMDIAFSLRKGFTNQTSLLRLNEAEDDLSDLLTADFLIIDDLGTQSLHESRTLEYLLYLLDNRQNKNLKTIITSNIEIVKWQNILDERFFSRLFGNFSCLNFTGQDLRQEERVLHLRGKNADKTSD